VTRQTLDFSQPIALMLVAVLHFVPDSDGPRQIIDTLLGALPSGSYLAATHVTAEHDPDTLAGAGRAYQERGLSGQIRTADEFAELAFRGLEMVDPGLTLVSEWRPRDAGPRPMASEVNAYGGVARKP
jgi:S-adenosyl methyltransferase